MYEITRDRAGYWVEFKDGPYVSCVGPFNDLATARRWAEVNV